MKICILDVNELFYAYIIEQNKIYEHFLIKCEFKLVVNDNQYCPSVMSELYSNKTMCFWYKLQENVINDFKDEGYSFNHLEEMNSITIV